MEKGFAPIWLILGVLIVGATILFTPIPQQYTSCKPHLGGENPPCHLVWKFGPSLWQSLTMQTTSRGVETSTIPQPSPTDTDKTFTFGNLKFQYPSDLILKDTGGSPKFYRQVGGEEKIAIIVEILYTIQTDPCGGEMLYATCTIVGPYKALLQGTDDGDSDFNGAYQFIHYNMKYSVSFYKALSQEEQNKILSTFIFLDQKQTVSCEEILKRPSPPNAGIDLEQAYCTGYGCNDAKNKSDCESRDILKVEKSSEESHLVGGMDGVVDCKWLDSNSPVCITNLK